MSELFALYIVDEKKLPTNLDGMSDQQKYDRLVKDVLANGAKWAQLELFVPAFAEGLETVDDQMGGFDVLPVYAFNKSPHDLLGKNGDCPCFGYFNPPLIHDLVIAFGEIPTEAIARFEADEGAVGQVYAAFQSSIVEADKRGYALAVLHD